MYKLVLIYISQHGCLSATTGFMPSLYKNHRAEKLSYIDSMKPMVADKPPC